MATSAAALFEDDEDEWVRSGVPITKNENIKSEDASSDELSRRSETPSQPSPNTEIASSLDSESSASSAFGKLSRTHALCKCSNLGADGVDAPNGRQELYRLMNRFKADQSEKKSVVLCIPRLAGGDVVVTSPDGATIYNTFSVKRILFCSKGIDENSDSIGFTTHAQKKLEKSSSDSQFANPTFEETEDSKGLTEFTEFLCHVFQFQDEASTEHTLQCFAQAFGSGPMAGRGTGKVCTDPLQYSFDVSVALSESDGKTSSNCHHSKDCFKLRVGYRRSVHLTITQTSGQQMIVESAFGILVGQGRGEENLRALEMSTKPVKEGKSLTLSGTWTPPDVLKEEMPKDAPALTFTVAIDVQFGGLANTLRLVRDFKVRTYKASERFYGMKRPAPVKSMIVNLKSQETSTGSVEYFVESVSSKDPEKGGYLERLNKYLKNKGQSTEPSDQNEEDDEVENEVAEEETEEEAIAGHVMSGTGVVSKELTQQKLEAWNELLSKWDTVPRSKIRNLARKGVPDLLRDQVWRQLVPTGLADSDLIEAYPHLVGKESQTEQVILWDLTRTFPGNEFFAEKGGVGQTRLYNICKAYSVYDEEIGYCQGLSFMAAVLLLHTPEEEAFCLFIKLMFDYGLRDMYRSGFAELKLKFFQLTRLMEEHLPDLSAHFNDLGIETHMFASQWFLTVYAAKFPLCTAYHVMDVLLSEGQTILFNIALGLLKLSRKDLLQLDFEGIMRYFRVDLPRLYSTEATSFRLIATSTRFKISEKKLKKIEADYVEKMRAEELEADPLTRAQEDNKKLQADVMRLEAENETLAYAIVNDKIEMQSKIEDLDVKLNTATRENERLNKLLERLSFEAEEDKTQLEHEAAQVKAMYRSAMEENEETRQLLDGRRRAAEEALVDATQKFESEKTGLLELIKGMQAREALSEHDSSKVELQQQVHEAELEVAKLRGEAAESNLKIESLQQQLKVAQSEGGSGSSQGISKWFKR
eukprot:m.41919 g.41919  ORF g.41919 m.41919 type:complete len:983 (-) comp9824_c0_seq1:91-3039(-)